MITGLLTGKKTAVNTATPKAGGGLAGLLTGKTKTTTPAPTPAVVATPAGTTSPIKPTTKKMPEFLGGGEFNVGAPGELVKSTKSFPMKSEKGMWREHLYPAALGGESTNYNVKLYTKEQGREKTNYELEQIRLYKAGKVSLPEARANIIQKYREITGLDPSDEEMTVKGQILPAVKEIVPTPTKMATDIQKATVGVRQGLKSASLPGVADASGFDPAIVSNLKTKGALIYDIQGQVDLGASLKKLKEINSGAAAPVAPSGLATTIAPAKSGLTGLLTGRGQPSQVKSGVFLDSSIPALAAKKLPHEVTVKGGEAEQLAPAAAGASAIAKQVGYGAAPERFMEKTPLEKAKSVLTAPIRYTAGSLAQFAVRSALEKTNSDLQFTPKKQWEELLIGPETLKRMSEDESLYGMAYQWGKNKLIKAGVPEQIAGKSGMAGAFILGSIIENPFVVGVGKGAKKLFQKSLKETLEKEIGSKIAKEELPRVIAKADEIFAMTDKTQKETALRGFIDDFKTKSKLAEKQEEEKALADAKFASKTTPATEGLVRPPAKAPAGELSADLQILAGNAKRMGLTKKQFIAEFEKGLADQNLTRREGIQKIADSIKTKLGQTLDEFFDKHVKEIKKPDIALARPTSNATRRTGLKGLLTSDNDYGIMVRTEKGLEQKTMKEFAVMNEAKYAAAAKAAPEGLARPPVNSKYNEVNQKVAKLFEEAKGQKVIGEKEGTSFELGDWGKSHQDRKLGEQKLDRFDEKELPSTIKNIKQVYRASDNPELYRSDNLAWISVDEKKQTRVIYTRKNKNGAEEIIGWHSIPDEKKANYLDNLASFGAPDRARTGKNGLEHRKFIQLAYGDKGSLTYPPTGVKSEKITPKGLARPPVKVAEKPMESVGDVLKRGKQLTRDDAITKNVTNKAEAQVAFEAFQKPPATGRTPVFPELMIQPDKLKDITGFKGYARDVYRNFKAFFGEKYEAAKKAILDPFDAAKGKYVDDQAKELAELDDYIVKKLGIKKGSDESALVMDFGEGGITQPEIIAAVGTERAKNIVAAADWFRAKYDKFLDEINAERKRIYGAVWKKKATLDSEINLLKRNIASTKAAMAEKKDVTTLAYNKLKRKTERLNESLAKREALTTSEEWWRGKIIPKRKDYFRHYEEMTTGFEGLKNVFETPAGISPELVGVSPFTKPKSKWLGFAQKRIGKQSERDAVGGFLNYLPAYSYAKNIDPQVNQFRVLAADLADATKEDKNVNHFIEFLQNYANDLAGKTNPADRFIQEVIPGGRKTFGVINWINKRVKSNTILGNVASSIAQIFNVPQGIASAKQYSLRGVADTLAQIFRPSEAMKLSNFIKERYMGTLYDKFDESMLKIPKKFANWMTGVLDEVGTKFIWNSHYAKGKALKVADPIKYADDFTRELVGGRGIGEVPLIQKSKLFQLVAPFQLEVGNLWWVMGDMVKGKKFGSLATLLVANFLMNQAVKKIRGSDVTFDPINALLEGLQNSQNEPSWQGKTALVGGRLAGEVFSNIPLGQTVAVVMPEKGVKIPGAGTMTRREMFGSGDPTRFGGGLVAVKGLQDFGFKILPGYAGGQIKKTYTGAKALMAGEQKSKAGNILFDIKKTPQNVAGALAFGPYGTKEGKEYSKAQEELITVDMAQTRQAQKKRDDFKPRYNEIRAMVDAGKIEEAQAAVDALNDEEYEMYKSLKQSEGVSETAQAKREMLEKYKSIRAMVDAGKIEEAQAAVDALTDEEYKAYISLKKEFGD